MTEQWYWLIFVMAVVVVTALMAVVKRVWGTIPAAFVGVAGIAAVAAYRHFGGEFVSGVGPLR